MSLNIIEELKCTPFYKLYITHVQRSFDGLEEVKTFSNMFRYNIIYSNPSVHIIGAFEQTVLDGAQLVIIAIRIYLNNII